MRAILLITLFTNEFTFTLLFGKPFLLILRAIYCCFYRTSTNSRSVRFSDQAV